MFASTELSEVALRIKCECLLHSLSVSLCVEPELLQHESRLCATYLAPMPHHALAMRVPPFWRCKGGGGGVMEWSGEYPPLKFLTS